MNRRWYRPKEREAGDLSQQDQTQSAQKGLCRCGCNLAAAESLDPVQERSARAGCEDQFSREKIGEGFAAVTNLSRGGRGGVVDSDAASWEARRAYRMRSTEQVGAVLICCRRRTNYGAAQDEQRRAQADGGGRRSDEGRAPLAGSRKNRSC